MKRIAQIAFQMMLTGILLLGYAVPGFAESLLVPNEAAMEQGFQLLTVDVEGAEGFRFVGKKKDGLVQYQGKLKPGGTLKFVIKATLQDEKALPVTGRGCVVHMQVVVKKGVEVIKTQNFSKENKSNLFLNYTVPQDADTLEVTERFELINKSKDENFNKKVINRCHIILSENDKVKGKVAELFQKPGIKIIDDSDGKANVLSLTKDESGKFKTGKIDAGSNDMESKESNLVMIAAAVIVLLLAGGGVFFFMKKKKAGRGVYAKEEGRKREVLHVREPQHVSPGNAGHAVPSGEDGPARFCSNCGAELLPDSVFCEKCGERVQHGEIL